MKQQNYTLAEVKASSPIRTSLYEREVRMGGQVEAAFTEAHRNHKQHDFASSTTRSGFMCHMSIIHIPLDESLLFL